MSEPAPTPRETALSVAALRLGAGMVELAAPELFEALVYPENVRESSTSTTTRQKGARDVAMGLGALLASRRGDHALRGWTEAGALVDLLDTVIVARSRDVRPTVRAAGAVAGLAFGVAGVLTARRLGG